MEQIEEDTGSLDEGIQGGGFQGQAVLGPALAQVRLEAVDVSKGQCVDGGDTVMLTEIVEEQA